MPHFSIYPTSEFLKELRKESEDQGRSINNLILFILKKYITEKKSGGIGNA